MVLLDLLLEGLVPLHVGCQRVVFGFEKGVIIFIGGKKMGIIDVPVIRYIFSGICNSDTRI